MQLHAIWFLHLWAYADYALGPEPTVLKESREVPEKGLLREALLVKPSLVSRPWLQIPLPPLSFPRTSRPRPKPLEWSHYKSQEASRTRSLWVYARPPPTRLGSVVSTPLVAGQYLEAVEKGFGPEDEVGRADETEFANQGHRDGGGEPIARDGRDAPEPVPDVRHLRLLGGQDAHSRPTPRPGPFSTRPASRVEGVEAEAAQVAVQKAETDGRGATEFGRARERSEAKLPLPAAADDVDRKSRRLKSKYSFYHQAKARQSGGEAIRGGARQDVDTTRGK
ncbi:hypothetical protein D623_10013262 [Myotis brandtii]|uniref:Uncharacterized protein n=1 Tax=Myotis brandtii TaxID=109478 RepID=S7NWW1_MYOBR|nr:hypothetical protein D623_10013262 [Myotis brandtii]